MPRTWSSLQALLSALLLGLAGCGDSGGVAVPSADDLRKTAASAGAAVQQGAASAGSAIQEGAAQAGTAIGEAVDDIPVPPELRDINEKLAPLFGGLTDTLGTINDIESARDAVPKLKTLSEQVDVVEPLVKRLPAPARKALKSLLGGRLGRIKKQIDRVLEVKEVAETIRPVLDPLLAKLQALGG